MPNWIEGTLKLRGKREDIKRFFEEGLDASASLFGDEKIEDQVENYSENGCLDFQFKNEPHIKGTRRAFITDNDVYMYDEEGTVCVNVKQAWAFDARGESGDLNAWKNISEKYNIDIRLFGIEMGLEFTQEIIINRGKTPIVNEKQYEDWYWECPFPHMGG